MYCGLNYCGVVRVPEKHFGYAQKEPHLKGSASSKKWSISEILFNVWIGSRVKPRPTGDSTINEWPRFIRPRLSLSHSLMQHICLLEVQNYKTTHNIQHMGHSCDAEPLKIREFKMCTFS